MMYARVYGCVCVCLCVSVRWIYIYIEREREREIRSGLLKVVGASWE